LVALRQDAGRGRQGRPWVSDQGNFFGSTLVMLKPSDPSPASLSLAAGVALIRAVEAAAPATGLMLKWPNDLMMGAAKLAGVLLERSGDRLVAGFGVNLAHAPAIEERETAALAEVALLTPEGFAPLLAASFARALDMWRHDLPRLLTSWVESAHPHGTPLRVHAGPDEIVEGLFGGIDREGALQLELPGGELRVIHAADVEMLGG